MYLGTTHWFYFIIAEIIPICGSVYYTAITKWIFFNSIYLKIVNNYNPYISWNVYSFVDNVWTYLCVRTQDPEGLGFFLSWIIACSEVNSGILWHSKDSAVSSIIGIGSSRTGSSFFYWQQTDWLTDWRHPTKANTLLGVFSQITTGSDNMS